MSYIYHPVTGERILFSELDNESAFIEDRLFKPKSWNVFYVDEDDKDSKTYGIEIELNVSSKDVNKRIDICKELLKVLNKEGRHFHIMRDNSVRNGIELVSAPMTYRYFISTFDIHEINELMNKLDLTATIDTGLHIHVGERHTQRLRELYIQLFSISYPLWIYLADRRVYRIQERYVSTKYFAEKEELRSRFDASVKSLLHRGKSSISYEGVEYYDYHFEDRYSGLNFCNTNTVEFRLFSGTNNLNDVLRYLNLVDATVKLADEISKTRVNDVFDLDTFVKRTNTESLLEDTVKYIKFINASNNRQRIYYNEYLLLDTHWYRIPVHHVRRRDLVLERHVYDEYVALRKELELHHKYPSSMNLKYDINQILTTNIYEVVKDTEEGIYLVKVKGDTNIVKLDPTSANLKYVFLRGVNSSLLVEKKLAK